MGAKANDNSQFLVFPQEGTAYLQFNGKDFCGMLSRASSSKAEGFSDETE